MRLIKYNGIDIKLTEREWKQLLRRFNARKATPNVFGYYCIHINSICVNRSNKCTQCPLGVVATGPNRCTYMFINIMGKELSHYVYMFDHAIMWNPEFDSEARQALKNIGDVLSAATKVSR